MGEGGLRGLCSAPGLCCAPGGCGGFCGCREQPHDSLRFASAIMGHPGLGGAFGLEAEVVVGGGAVKGRDGQVVEAEVNAELGAVVDHVVEELGAVAGGRAGLQR